MKTFIKLLFSASILLTFWSCNSEKVNLHENRIEGDYWVVTQFIVNDIDSTDFVKYSSILGYRFEKDPSYDDDKDNFHEFNRIHEIMEVSSDGTETLIGHWGRKENNKMLFNTEYKREERGPFYLQDYMDIIQIKKSKMEYKLTHDGNTYELILER